MGAVCHQRSDDPRRGCDRHLGRIQKRLYILAVLLRFVPIFTIYKICDMTLIDNFLLLKFHFFQHYYPEAAQVMEGRKYGFNIVSQLLKLFVIFPAVSALAAWICTLF